MSHTPGPWEINDHHVEAVGGICRARIAILDDGAGTNPEADAHLIAAAPDMLEALEGAERLLTWMESGRVHKEPEPQPIRERIQEAIAKAKGEA